MKMQRTNQGGSVASFIIIGIILISGLIGAVYLLNRRGEQVRQDQAIAESEKQQPEKAPPEEAKDKPVVAASSEGQTASSKPDDSGASQDLPATGPGLAVGEIFVLSLLTTVTASYLLSRRKSARSL